MKKTVVITGASRGIGRAIAMRFAQNGYRVAGIYHHASAQADRTRVLLEQSGGEACLYACDVADRHAVDETLRQILAFLGHIDVLVNNAGIEQQKLFTQITNADWDRMIGVNLSGVFYLTRAVCEHMIARKYGRIINISSIWGQTGGSCEVHYSAAKAGVEGLTRALAKELAPSHITVNAVAPGAIATSMTTHLGEETCRMLEEEIPLGRLGKPEEVASAVYFLAGEDAGYITGQVLGVNGGLLI